MSSHQQELANYLNDVLLNRAWAETGEEIADIIINRFGYSKREGGAA